MGHNFASQQQAGHTSHPSQSRHGSTHQRYAEVQNMYFISGSGTISRNQQGSREDVHSAESRDSRISTNANSQSSSVYDNVKVRWLVAGGMVAISYILSYDILIFE